MMLFSHRDFVGGEVMASKGVHALIPPDTYEYITFRGKRDFIPLIKLRALSWKGGSGLFRWTRLNHRGLCKREAELGTM